MMVSPIVPAETTKAVDGGGFDAGATDGDLRSMMRLGMTLVAQGRFTNGGRTHAGWQVSKPGHAEA